MVKFVARIHTTNTLMSLYNSNTSYFPQDVVYISVGVAVLVNWNIGMILVPWVQYVQMGLMIQQQM